MKTACVFLRNKDSQGCAGVFVHAPFKCSHATFISMGEDIFAGGERGQREREREVCNIRYSCFQRIERSKDTWVKKINDP